MLNRRRFLSISACAGLVPLAARAETHVVTGIALGAKVTLRLNHPDAANLADLAMAEVRRLERIFSLYIPDSTLSQLNQTGRLDLPPFELLECLTIANAVYLASGGRFDPSVQPLWQAQAQATVSGRPIPKQAHAALLASADWQSVSLSPKAIVLGRAKALTLNGIAQGYIADRIAHFLAQHGLENALIDTGEMVALPTGSWPVHLASGAVLSLQNRALATSAPMGMTFGGDGKTSHILDPRTGNPVQSHWKTVSISATKAALADALSTAACLTWGEDELSALVAAFPSARIEASLRA